VNRRRARPARTIGATGQAQESRRDPYYHTELSRPVRELERVRPRVVLRPFRDPNSRGMAAIRHGNVSQLVGEVSRRLSQDTNYRACSRTPPAHVCRPLVSRHGRERKDLLGRCRREGLCAGFHVGVMARDARRRTAARIARRSRPAHDH